LRSPTGYVELRFWSRRRASVSIYYEDGWPSRRLTRWVTAGDARFVRALRRAGFDAEEADRVAERISNEWGEPVGDVADAMIPAATFAVLAAIGAVTLGRWLLGAAGVGPRR